MSGKKTACAITMVKDDHFFLERWVKYYGDALGRDALYVVNHGGGREIADLAEGCSVIDLPGGFDANFDILRWRLFNNLANGLRGYYTFVIVTDVDEFVVVDPRTGLGLVDFLGRRRGKVTAMPLGLEVVHQPALEPDAIGDGPMLGPRRYARFTTAYSKPVVFNHAVKLSRGGHYSTDAELKIFRNLYLFHMRYVDETLHRATLDRRAAQMAAIGAGKDDNLISGHWAKTPDKPPLYDELVGLPIHAGFDFGEHTKRMEETWELRDESSRLYHVARDIAQELQTVPERFFGLV